MTRVLLVGANLVLVAVYAVGSGFWVSTGDSWYRGLQRPAWQPPDVVFGIIWPYNFLMLAIVGTLIAVNASVGTASVWVGCFAASVVAALAWANLFYVQHQLNAASVSLGIAVLFTVPMVVAAFRYGLVPGLTTVPYLLWLATATSLSVGYTLLNSGQPG